MTLLVLLLLVNTEDMDFITVEIQFLAAGRNFREGTFAAIVVVFD